MHMGLRRFVAALLPLLLCAGCASTGDAISPEPQEKGSQARPIISCWDAASGASRRPPSQEANAGAAIRDVQQDAWTLRLTVTYSGGCAQHDFELCWEGEFLTSDPAQVHFWLLHEPHGDACKKLVTEERVFDLSPLKGEGGTLERCGVPGYWHRTDLVSCQVPWIGGLRWPWPERPPR